MMKRLFWLCCLVGMIVASVMMYQKMLLVKPNQQQDRQKQDQQKQAQQKQDQQKQDQQKQEQQNQQQQTAKQLLQKRLAEKSQAALLYAQKHGFDLQHAILIDFSLHSGTKRFFVWNFATNSVEFSSLVAHGYGNEQYRSTTSDIIFSNVDGSYASSLGKYKIGIRSYSKWGINVHYKLHGLEETNNNAFKRIIVLHSYQYVPEQALYPFHLPLGYSQGCPVIDNTTMRQMDALLKTKRKPVLLWMYN